MSTEIVDNTNSSIVYAGAWSAGSVHVGDFNSTTSITTQVDASFSYYFVGTSITVWGCLLPNTTSFANFSIDGTPLLQRLDGTSAQYIAQVRQFTSPNLTAGAHTLTVGVPAQGDGAPSAYCLDFLEYTRPDVVTLSATPYATGTVVSSYATVPTFRSSPAANLGRQPPNLAVVLPAVLVPCLLVIAGLIVALVYARRRRAREEDAPPPLPERPPYVPTTPYAPFASAAMAEKEKDVKLVDKDGNPVFLDADRASVEAPPTYVSQ
ncbi:hypothetical protein PsYK624_150860 [Phanerochaete sordida]|uniref:Uncharacterized protein n=1 Tax=Phanerochaete sordida TaxID=48140 RepID=A0A9P3GR67_9APHY|nr:hypothetical protein PsYK624_150860 [Phanerochaete sordida]